jgi:hypothetical protein
VKVRRLIRSPVRAIAWAAWLAHRRGNPPPPPPPAQLTINGKGFLLGGNAWTPYGFSDGHFELSREGDEAAEAAIGATCLRTPLRKYGTYGTGYQQDMQQEGAPGDLKPAYLSAIVARLIAARAVGMRNFIAMDSDKGQGAEASGGNDFFSGSTEGNRQRALFIGTAVYLAQNYGSLIDAMEPLVEPSSSVVASKEILWAYQEEFMTAVMAVAPNMLFAIGPRDYAAGNIANAINPAWLDPGSPFYGHVFMTCNFLDNLSMNPTQRASRAALVASTRNTQNVPAWVNQLATHNSNDPDNTNLDSTAALLNAADGGPIYFNYWERTSMAGTSDGCSYLSNQADPNSPRLYHSARISVLTAHFAGLPYWMSAPVIIGTPTQGSTVAYLSGRVAGRPAPTVTARVRVNGVDKGDAATYVIQAADVGLQVVIRQTGTNAAGSTFSDSGAVYAVGDAAATVLDLRMLGGQIDTPLDYSGLAMYQDLAKSARNFAKDVTGFRYQEATTLLKVASLTRVSNVVSVVLSAAPASYASEQDIATGMRLVLTCLQDPTFDADHAVITVTDQTHFTYTTTGQADASYVAVSEYDVPATVINSVAVDSEGNPTESFCAVLSTVTGSATSKPDLNGTYVGFFPGTPPTGLTFDGAVLSGWTSGSPNFTLTISGTQSAFVAMHVSGVSAGFKMPRIIPSNLDTSGSTLLRPEFVQFYGRFLRVLRCMDAGRTNSNAFIKSWAKRPVVSCGMGMTLEDMVKACNELGCDLWYCFPHWATDDYVTQLSTYVRDNLNPSLKFLPQSSNEEWNDRTFPHLAWCMTRIRKLLKGHFHGNKGESVITSVTKVGGVVTVTMNRPPPFANGATAVFAITAGSTSGYNTPDAGATMTVSGNSFSFSGNTGSGTATCTEATIIGEPTDPFYSWDHTKTYRELANRMHALRTYQIAQLVSAVFGGLNGRARMLLMNWFSNTVPDGNLEAMGLRWLEAQYGPTKDWLWGLGGAPYPLAEESNTTSTQVMASLRTGHDDALDTYDVQYHRSSYLAHRYAHEHIQYEGGPDLTPLGDNTALVDAVYGDPDYRTFNKELVQRSLAAGVDVYVPFYTSMAFPGTKGPQCWGIGRTLAADKGIGSAATTRIQGIDDVLLAPPPAFTDPNKLPGTLYYQGGSGFIDDTAGTGLNNGMRQLFSSSSQVENLFFVDPANDGRDITLTVYGGILVGGGANGVRVYLDDVLIGTCNLPATTHLADMASGGAASGPFVLPTVSAGKHRLKIKAPVSQPDEVGVSRVVGV